jgi:hypothetical protein
MGYLVCKLWREGFYNLKTWVGDYMGRRKRGGTSSCRTRVVGNIRAKKFWLYSTLYDC